MTRYLHILYLSIIGLAVGSAFWAWYHPKIETKTVYSPPNVITKTETVTVPCRPVQIVKDKVRFIEKQPQVEPFVDKGEDIIGEAEIAPSEGKQEVLAKINPAGETSFIVIPKQRPLFSFENDRRLIIRYGFVDRWSEMSVDIHKEIDVGFEWNFFRLGNIHMGFYGEGNTSPEAKAMFQMSYKF